MIGNTYYDKNGGGRRLVTLRMETEESLHQSTKIYDEAEAWDVLLEDFVNFLESCGYVGVHKRISVEDSPFVSGWTGKVHSSET